MEKTLLVMISAWFSQKRSKGISKKKLIGKILLVSDF